MSPRISIVLADDHGIVRQGLRALLDAQADLTVVGEAADGAETIAMVAKLHPDVLVLDLLMPGLDGLEVLRHLEQQKAPPRVVVLSMHSDEAYVVEALRLGAAAYVLKDAGVSDLVHAVREVMAGHRYLSAPLGRRAIDAYAKRTEATQTDDSLTARELEVLRLAARGHSVQRIAEELSISPRTAETHRGNLMKKLGLHNQTDLVRYAIRRGIVPPYA